MTRLNFAAALLLLLPNHGNAQAIGPPTVGSGFTALRLCAPFAPTDLKVLTWSASAHCWGPGAGGGGGTWGSITGTLSGQTDLWGVLGGKQATITGAPGAWPSTFAPSAHHTSHQNGGADEIATPTPGANAIPRAGSGGQLAIGWLASGSPTGNKFVRDDGTLADPPGSGVSDFTGATATAPAFSATPTFSLADVSVKSPVRIEPGALTANVTSVTFTNKTAGAKFSIAWLQDGTGGRTVSYGASASNACTIDPTASVTTTQQFEVGADGTTVNGVGCSTNGAGATFAGPEEAAPGTPAANTALCWFDSTDHAGFECKANNSANVFKMLLGTYAAYVDPTSSIQMQLNGKAASGAATTVNGQTCALGSTCTVADATKGAAVLTPVTYSATPTFTVSASSTPQVFTMTLTGNVTSSTLVTTNARAGQSISFILTQDATGGRTFAWPTNVLGACGAISATPSVATTASGIFDGTNVNSGGCTSNDPATIVVLGPTRSAVATPPSGNVGCWLDSTLNTQLCIDSTGRITSMLAVPTLSAGFLKYSGSAWAFDNTTYLSGIVAEANGGTGANNTVGAAGHVLRSNGTHYVDSAILAADVPATPVPAPGATITLAAPRGYAICTGTWTCAVAVPAPAAGYEFCVMNDDNVATAITLSALGASAMYENSARTAYGTAGTGTLALSAAAANKVCIVGRDATHYLTVSYNGAVTVN